MSTRAAHPGWVLLTCMLASSLSFVDGSVVNVSLPFIGQALGRSPAALQWVVDAYLLPLSALILLGGAAGDRFGRGRLLVVGIAVFGVGSALCTVAPGYATLLAARALQGVGAAILLPNSLATLAATFEGEARGARDRGLVGAGRGRGGGRAGAGRLAGRPLRLARDLPHQPAGGRGGGAHGLALRAGRGRARPVQGAPVRHAGRACSPPWRSGWSPGG